MTARSLTGNFANFGAYFTYKLRSLRSVLILNGIFALLSYPLMMGGVLPYAYNEVAMERLRETGLQESEAFANLERQSDTLGSLAVTGMVIGFIMLAAMFLMSYVICSKSFRWLYKKSIVDMDYSLPVSDDTRFFGDLLASLAGSMVPHLLAILVGSGLYWCMPFEALGADPGENAQVFRLLIQLIGTGFVSCIMFMGISLLVMSFCGRVIEARIMPFVINAAIPIIHAVCIVMLVSNMYGYSASGDYEYRAIAATSPLGLLVMTLISIFSSTYDGSIENVRVIMLCSDVLVPLLIVIIGSFAASYFLIRFRRAERVGSPYVYPVVKTLIPAVVLFTVVSLFMAVILSEAELSTLGIWSGAFVAMGIVTFIIYIIMELISGKGFKRFHITLIKYVVTMVVSVLLCVILSSTNGMGYARFVPDADQIGSAYLSLSTNEDFSDCRWDTAVTDAESLEALLAYHNSLSRKETKGESENEGCYFSVNYYLKTGSSVSRRYSLSRAEYMEAIGAVVTPEVHYNNIMQYFSYYLSDENTVSNIVAVYHDDKLKLTDFPLEELKEALRKDCENISLSLLCSDTEVEKDYVTLTIKRTGKYEDGSSYNYTNDERLEIYSWYENTIALLEREGVKGPLFADNTNKCRTAFAVKIPVESYYGGYNMYDIDAETLLVASVADQLTDEELEQLGYGYKYYYDYPAPGGSGTVDTVARIDIIRDDWELFAFDDDDPNAQKLKEWSSDIMPFDYNKAYDQKEYVIITLFTDASAERLEADGYVTYNYEIIGFITPENYEKAIELLDNIA